MHRHKYIGRKFKREKGHRDLMLRNLATSLILHEKVKTTLPKAKEIRPIVEKLITKGRKNNLLTRRTLNSYLLDKNATEKLMVEISPLYENRNGGYTRIVKLGVRPGDAAEMAYIELLDTEKLAKKVKEAEKTKAKPAEKKGAANKETRKIGKGQLKKVKSPKENS